MKTLSMKPRFCFILIAALCAITLSPSIDAADFLFVWDPSPDPSVSAYGIYQRSGDSPYQKIDEVRVQDLDDPAHPSYRVTGLGDGATFWFAVTAISASDSESDFANQTCITVNGQVVECTEDDENSAAIIVSCFIGAAGERISQQAAGR
jgi:fibronectin type 3 domain-containing protein